MLGVYDILCLALLGMAFSSLCFTNVLSTLMYGSNLSIARRSRRYKGRLRVVFSSHLEHVAWPG
jgi:hypothetical protein